MKKYEQPKDVRVYVAELSGPFKPSCGIRVAYEKLYGLGGMGGGLIARYLSNQLFLDADQMLIEMRREAFNFLDVCEVATEVKIPIDREGKETEIITRESMRPLKPIVPDLSGGASTKAGSAQAMHGGDAAAGTAFGPAPHITAPEFAAANAPKADPFDIGDA